MTVRQKDYIAQGVAIKPPTGIETQYKFILPPFVSLPKQKLVYKLHYFHTFAELKEKYPSPIDLHNISGILDDTPEEMLPAPSKRVSKKSWRLRDDDNTVQLYNEVEKSNINDTQDMQDMHQPNLDIQSQRPLSDHCSIESRSPKSNSSYTDNFRAQFDPTTPHIYV